MSHPPLFSCRSVRLWIAVLLMFAIYVEIGTRSSFSMTAECMLNVTKDKDHKNVYVPEAKNCPNNDSEKSYHGTVQWTEKQKSNIFTATYIGNMVSTALSGYIADKYGPKTVLLSAIALSTGATYMDPFLITSSYVASFISRIFTGLAEGCVAPSVNSMASRWFPPLEKARMIAIYTSGNQLASATASYVSALFCEVNFLGGWPLVFYTMGLAGITWYIVFSIVSSDYPADNRCASEAEKEYLSELVVSKKQAGAKVPWCRMLLSPTVLCVFTCHAACFFGVSCSQNFFPQFFRQRLHLTIKQNANYVAVPFLTQLVTKNIIAPIGDYLKSSGKVSPVKVIRSMQFCCGFGSAAAFICLAFIPDCETPWVALIFLVAYGTAFGMGMVGFYTSLLSIAPSFAGTLSSCSYICAQFASLSATGLNTLIVNAEWKVDRFKVLFCTAAGIHIASTTFFLFFGAAEVQEWAKPREDNEKPEEEKTMLEASGETADGTTENNENEHNILTSQSLGGNNDSDEEE